MTFSVLVVHWLSLSPFSNRPINCDRVLLKLNRTAQEEHGGMILEKIT